MARNYDNLCRPYQMNLKWNVNLKKVTTKYLNVPPRSPKQKQRW